MLECSIYGMLKLKDKPQKEVANTDKTPKDKSFVVDKKS